MPLALDLQVEREHERRALRRFRTLDEGGGEAAIAHDVELEPERLAGAFGHVLDRADRHRGERERHAECIGGARCKDLAIGPVETEEPHRRERHRHRCFAAEQRDLRRALVDVDADALPQTDGLEVRAVGTQRAFAVSAAVDVLEDRARNALLRHLA